jgi:hypothetical protein
MSSVLNSQGVEFYWSNTTAYSTASTCLVGEVTDFSGPGGQAAVIDVTHLGSTAREKRIGIRDEGQMTLGVNFVPADVAQAVLRSDRATRTMKKCVIKFNDTTAADCNKAVFEAYCSGFSISGGVDQKVAGQVVLEVANAVTYTTASS